jgi:membrane protease YdiL (CAAX protease family)
MINPLFKQSHPLIKLIFLLSLMFVSFSFVMIAGILTNGNNTNSMKFLSAIQQIFLFIIPALLASFLYSGNPKRYLYFNRTDLSMFVFVFIIMILAVPVINYTGLINSKLHLPESLSRLEDSIKKFEEEAEKLTLGFLTVSTFPAYLLNLLIIAILPAIGEELIFRGIIFNLFKEWVKNKHAAVIITAFIFSFIHFQFYGFLPRFLLGVLFGYLLIWSSSIWLPITAHFINNAFAVSFYYFGNSKNLIKKAENFGTDSSTFIFLIVSVFILAFFLYRFYKTGKEYPPQNKL